jgi:hypothetical protein
MEEAQSASNVPVAIRYDQPFSPKPQTRQKKKGKLTYTTAGARQEEARQAKFQHLRPHQGAQRHRNHRKLQILHIRALSLLPQAREIGLTEQLSSLVLKEAPARMQTSQ